MINAKKGDWVQIHEIVLSPEERTARLPEDTKKVPVELWVKGYLNQDAILGEDVQITTLTGRSVRGELVSINPAFTYGFGEEFVPELLKVGHQVRELLKDGEAK